MPVSRLQRPRFVSEAVEAFVARTRAGAILSISDGVWTIRQQFPRSEHTDEELAELIASIAIAKSRNYIAFDRDLLAWSPLMIAAA